MEKEERIKILQKIVEQGGYCPGIDCAPCQKAFDLDICPAGGASSDRHLKRVEMAEQELIKLNVITMKGFLVEEEDITLDQNN